MPRSSRRGGRAARRARRIDPRLRRVGQQRGPRADDPRRGRRARRARPRRGLLASVRDAARVRRGAAPIFERGVLAAHDLAAARPAPGSQGHRAPLRARCELGDLRSAMPRPRSADVRRARRDLLVRATARAPAPADRGARVRVPPAARRRAGCHAPVARRVRGDPARAHRRDALAARFPGERLAHLGHRFGAHSDHGRAERHARQVGARRAREFARPLLHRSEAAAATQLLRWRALQRVRFSGRRARRRNGLGRGRRDRRWRRVHEAGRTRGTGVRGNGTSHPGHRRDPRASG